MSDDSILASATKGVKVSERQQKLLAKAQSLPTLAGCYLMKGERGQVIYIGKAKSLRSRVCSYFNQAERSIKVEAMANKVLDFDFLVTASEAEAYVVENNLIKKHLPKYNIRLRDDKSYPYVSINLNEPFARLEYVRRPKRAPQVLLFGPYPTGLPVGQVMKALTKTLRLRDCSLAEFKNRERPCLLYQIHQCSAPCVGLISEASYAQRLQWAIDFFKSKPQATIEFLTQQMIQLAEREKFEEAALIRDMLPILQDYTQVIGQKHAELLGQEEDVDVVGVYQGESEVDLVFYMIRRGILIGQKTFHYLNAESFQDQTSELKELLVAVYADHPEEIPEKIILNLTKADLSDLEQVFEIIAPTRNVKVLSNQGRWQSASRLACEQAKEGQRVRLENEDSPYLGLHKLKFLLSLKELPRRLEMVDIAIFQGSSPTAGLVVFVDGKADKTQYRHYHLEKRPEGNNDFAMMREFVARRFKKEDRLDDPDVLIVDGGKGQVSSVREALRELGLEIPVVGLAKSKTESDFRSEDVKATDERLIIPGRANPYMLRQCGPLFRILIVMRDEAHRFCRRLHHHQEKEKLLSSWVDEIEGVGPKARSHLMKAIRGGPDIYRGLSVQELMVQLRVRAPLAKNIFIYLERKFS